MRAVSLDSTYAEGGLEVPGTQGSSASKAEIGGGILKSFPYLEEIDKTFSEMIFELKEPQLILLNILSHCHCFK